MSVSSTAFIAHAPTGPRCTALTFVSDAADAPRPGGDRRSVP